MTDEDPDTYRGILDGGKDLQVAAAVWTVLEIDLKYALEQARLAHAGWRRAVRSASAIIARVTGVDALAWDDVPSGLACGEHAEALDGANAH